MSSDVERWLMEVRADIKAMREELAPPPRVMRYEKAAKMLDVSKTVLKEMIARGEIVPVRIGGRKKIPLSEVERVSTPCAEPGEARRALRAPKASGPRVKMADELAKLEAVAARRRRARR